MICINNLLELVTKFDYLLSSGDRRKPVIYLEYFAVWDILFSLFSINSIKRKILTPIPFLWWYISIDQLLRLSRPLFQLCNIDKAISGSVDIKIMGRCVKFPFRDNQD